MRDYRVQRLLAFLDPWADPRGHGYQLVQSQLAFGAGGLFGVGFGAGQQKLFFLPEAHNDFILSVVGEEVGLFGVALVLIGFAVLALASLGIAQRAKSSFATLRDSGRGAHAVAAGDPERRRRHGRAADQGQHPAARLVRRHVAGREPRVRSA